MYSGKFFNHICAELQKNINKEASLNKISTVVHCPGHKNSQGDLAEWCIKQEGTGKILSSHTSKEKAEEHLKQIEMHKHMASTDKVADFDHQTIQTQSMPSSLVTQIRKIQEGIDKSILDETENEPKYLDKGLQSLLHCTILFGIEESDKDKIKEIVKKYVSKGIKATNGEKIEYFDNKDQSVAYVPVISESLTALHEELKSSVKNQDKHPEYKAHICVAYLKPKARLQESKLEKESWDIKSIELTKKSGDVEKISRMKMALTDEPLKEGDILVDNATKKEVKIKEVCHDRKDKDGVYDFILEDGAKVLADNIGEGKQWSKGIVVDAYVPWGEMQNYDKPDQSKVPYQDSNLTDESSRGTV